MYAACLLDVQFPCSQFERDCKKITFSKHMNRLGSVWLSNSFLLTILHGEHCHTIRRQQTMFFFCMFKAKVGRAKDESKISDKLFTWLFTFPRHMHGEHTSSSHIFTCSSHSHPSQRALEIAGFICKEVDKKIKEQRYKKTTHCSSLAAWECVVKCDVLCFHHISVKSSI